MWTKKRKDAVGRIIFADFLEQPLHKYLNIIEEAEKELYSRRDIASAGFLSEVSGFGGEENRSSAVVAEIAINGNDLCIKYVDDAFNKIYTVHEKLSSSLHYKLKRISSRNELTHRILEGIIKQQEIFLFSGNPADLAPLSQVVFVKRLNREQSNQIDNSWVSRLVSKISVVTPFGKEKILKSFFPTRKDINKELVKLLLEQEREEIESGKLNRTLTDKQLKSKIEMKYGIFISRWSMLQCRKVMGIPKAGKRLSEYKYPPLLAGFSKFYDLTPSEASKNAPSGSGVYELSLMHREIEYPNGRISVFYIGSTKNVRKRLKEHLKENTRNRDIRYCLKSSVCSFRYILLSNNWKEQEHLLYSLFVASYGKKPICNRISPCSK